MKSIYTESELHCDTFWQNLPFKEALVKLEHDV